MPAQVREERSPTLVRALSGYDFQPSRFWLQKNGRHSRLMEGNCFLTFMPRARVVAFVIVGSVDGIEYDRSSVKPFSGSSIDQMLLGRKPFHECLN